MLGNIVDLFVKCMRKVTKYHLHNLLGILDYYVIYRQRGQASFLKCLQNAPMR